MDLNDLEARARERLEASAYDYYAGGADDEIALAESTAAWQRRRLRYRVLRDVSAVDTSTTVLGTRLPAPILVAPTAYHRLAHDEGEIATARGAAIARTPMVVSTLATISLGDIAAAVPGATRWFQLYVQRDRALTEDLVHRAVAAGCSALVLTVDLPGVVGYRRRDERNAFTLPEGLSMANLGSTTPDVDGSGLAAYALAEVDPSLTPADIGWLAELSGLPVLVKGVVRGDDARACVDAGAAGIVVSNHGGRQLDRSIATADALPDVVEAVGDDGEVLVDGGIRSGTDVVTALALGAKAVLLGRPVLWALATGGAQGVQQLLEGMASEVARAMALCGAATVDEVTADLLA